MLKILSLENFKKILTALVVPLGALAIAGLIMFGINKMLTTEPNYKELVEELDNTTFGNKWIAAYELSKYLNSNKIPELDKPWFIGKLISIFNKTEDEKTKSFLIVALSNFPHESVQNFMRNVIIDKNFNNSIKFNALYYFGNFNSKFPEHMIQDEEALLKESEIIALLSSEDLGIVQVAIFMLANRKSKISLDVIAKLLDHQDRNIKYAAAISLIGYKDKRALDLLKEILSLKYPETKDRSLIAQYDNWKINVLNALIKSQWRILVDQISQLSRDNSNLTLSVKAKEVLISFNQNQIVK
jgi:hypothetical protein